LTGDNFKMKDLEIIRVCVFCKIPDTLTPWLNDYLRCQKCGREFSLIETVFIYKPECKIRC